MPRHCKLSAPTIPKKIRRTPRPRVWKVVRTEVLNTFFDQYEYSVYTQLAPIDIMADSVLTNENIDAVCSNVELWWGVCAKEIKDQPASTIEDRLVKQLCNELLINETIESSPATPSSTSSTKTVFAIASQGHKLIDLREYLKDVTAPAVEQILHSRAFDTMKSMYATFPGQYDMYGKGSHGSNYWREISDMPGKGAGNSNRYQLYLFVFYRVNTICIDL